MIRTLSSEIFFTAAKMQLHVRTREENICFGHQWSLRKLERGHLKHLTLVT